MESLIMDASTYTPGIRFSPALREFEIKGVSLPENVIEFYTPVLEWLDRFEHVISENTGSQSDDPLRLVFKLCYYNSGTVRYLISILNKMKRLIEVGMNVVVEWYYEKDDEHLLDNGKELAELTELPFSYIEM
jgi:hypothetical protein